MTEANWNLISKGTHFLGLLPLMWVAGLTAWRSATKQAAPSVEWWMLAAGYGVSWFADSVAQVRGTAEILAYNTYVLLQSALITAVLVPQYFPVLVSCFAFTGMVAVVFLGPTTLWPLHTVAWGTLAVLGLCRAGPLRWALVTSFGLGWLTWVAFRVSPTFENLGAYQCTRLLGTVMLCYAMRHPFPALRACASSTPWRSA